MKCGNFHGTLCAVTEVELFISDALSAHVKVLFIYLFILIDECE